MSQGIEEFLSNKALEEMQSRLRDSIDPKNWSVASRDGELDKIISIASDIVDDSVPATIKLLLTEIDGKNLLYWNVRLTLLGSLLEYLENARRELDWITESERENIAVDSNWLTGRIRQVILQYTEAQENLTKVLQQAQNSTMIDSEEL